MTELEDILARIFNLEQRDVKLYYTLLASGPMKITQISSAMNQDYTTTYLSVRRCMQARLIFRSRSTYRRGGRFYLYEAVDPEEILSRARETLQSWIAELNKNLTSSAGE